MEFMPAAESSGPARHEDEEAGVNWPLLLTASYASAVTLALAWLILSGRGLIRHGSGEDAPVLPEAAFERPARPSKSQDESEPYPPLPAINLTRLGKGVRLGDLEVTPRSIVLRPVELTRLQGATGEQRESPESLILTLELTNRSRDSRLIPLDPTFVRESSSTIDHSYIEMPRGLRIGMFHLAPESEWSLQDQIFPSLKPGESAETIVVSEPVTYRLPDGPFIWHIKLRIRPYQTDVLGVRFSGLDIEDQR